MSEQTTPSRLTLLLLLAALAAPATRAHAQAYTPPPPPLTTAPCVPTKKDPCTLPSSTPPPPVADKFAFPGDTPDAPADSTTKPIPPKPAGNDPFPFPTADSKAAPASSSSSSSSSSSTPDDPTPPLKDEGSSGSTPTSRRHKLAKVEDPNDRFAKDLEVSHFYLTTGDFLGSYNRAKDAVRLFPDDPEGHFALAAAAQKLKKNEEAIAEYNSYLKLEPDGDHVKLARHALTEIH